MNTLLAEMYGLEVSSAKISLITDKLLPLITEWRNRPLEAVYPIVFLDAMHFKVRVEGKVTSKAFYTVLAFTPEGNKDILGLYLSENEGARLHNNFSIKPYPQNDAMIDGPNHILQCAKTYCIRINRLRRRAVYEYSTMFAKIMSTLHFIESVTC